jgi:hypothetical protein
MKQFFLIIKSILSRPMNIIFMQIFGYHKPYRVALFRVANLIFKRFRPHFHSCLYETALEAKELDLKNISILEFGVAGGNGLMSIEKYCNQIEKKINIQFKIFGFDLGDKQGLPMTNAAEDLKYFWSSGDFKMNLEKLKKNLKKSELILGDINKTLNDFILNYIGPPIGAIFFDLDFYTSTKKSFEIFNLPEEYRMPRIRCYFDDIQAPTNNYNGVIKAINEFNSNNSDKKIAKFGGNSLDYKYGPWYEEFYEMHDFSHKNYNKKVLNTIVITEI